MDKGIVEVKDGREGIEKKERKEKNDLDEKCKEDKLKDMNKS